MSGLKQLATEQRPNIIWALLCAIAVAAVNTATVGAWLRYVKDAPLDVKFIIGLFLVSLISFFVIAYLTRRKAQADVEHDVCPDNWLHDLASGQAKAIHHWVYSDSCHILSHDLLRPTGSYIQFRFLLRNTSAHSVSLGALTGSIDFCGPLGGGLQWVRGLNDVIHPGAGRPALENECIIQLTLNDKTGVAQVLNQSSAFAFDQLNIAIQGEKVKSQNLAIKCDVSNRQLLDSAKYRRLGIEILKRQLEYYWNRRTEDGMGIPLDPIGSIINLHVRLVNPRDQETEIVSFKLDTSSSGSTRRTLAATGDLYEKPMTGIATDKTDWGTRLDPNLNICAFQAEPGYPHEGWLQFIVRGTDPQLLQGHTPTLIVLDAMGVEHRQGCPQLPIKWR